MANDEDDFSNTSPAPVDPALDDFARRLYRARSKKGWSEAELGRRAGVGRDSINNYSKSKTRPSALSLQKLAKALGVKEGDLMPGHVYAETSLRPNFEIRDHAKDRTRAWVFMDREVSRVTASKIYEMVVAEDAEKNAAHAR